MKFLVIGTGLAGITIAERIRNAGFELKVVSKTNQPSSTSIATGMYNPIVFRRLNKSWMIDDLLPVMHQFYNELSETLEINLDQKICFEKKIPNEDYAGWWNNRLNNSEYTSYMAPIKYGFGPVLKAGIIDCTLLKSTYESYLEKESLLINELFDFGAFTVLENQIEYKGDVYDYAVFADGPYAAQNPFFKWLPFNLCQGEWVIIKTEKEVCNRVINNKTNVIPLGNCRYKLSSTYSWQSLDWIPREEESKALCETFETMFDVPYEIVEHRAALRPTVADRRPYLGAHPEHKNLFIFNGLGSKGVMLAPYFSEHLINHITQNTPLLEEVNIQRHLKKYRQFLEEERDKNH